MTRIVVADTGPLFYLYLTGNADLLPKLFQEIHLPAAVRQELCHPAAPLSVRQWIESNPEWIVPAPGNELNDLETASLDPGERAAIALAELLRADLILMDERKGARVCRNKGFAVSGTLGILDLAARRGLIDLSAAFERLKKTNFRCRPELLEMLLNQNRV